MCGPGGAYGINHAVINDTCMRAEIEVPKGQAWRDFLTIEQEYITAIMGK